MSTRQCALRVFFALLVLLSWGCAALHPREPVDVHLAGIEPLKGQGLEFRMLFKVRIQNPNDQALDYNGVSIRMDVQGKRFAAGVSDASGSIPRFGEAVLEIPVSVSMFGIARQAVGVVNDDAGGKFFYEIRGRLTGSAMGDVRFKSEGEFAFPSELFEGHR